MPLPEFVLKLSNTNTNKIIYVYSYETPVGTALAAADDDFLYLLKLEHNKVFERAFQTIASELKCSFVEKQNKILKQLENELSLYFKGELKKFSVPVKTFGTDFQKEVWEALQEIPFGSTQTYSDIAKSIDRSSSHSRAVGAACGANSHLIIIPCHRVVATGSKGGFSSGVDRKEWLIDHEKKYYV